MVLHRILSYLEKLINWKKMLKAGLPLQNVVGALYSVLIDFGVRVVEC